MNIFYKNLLNHEPEPLRYKPEEKEYNDLRVSMTTGYHGEPSFYIQHSSKYVYDTRASNSLLVLSRETLEELLAAVTSTLEKVDTGEFKVCVCGNYVPADKACCVRCEKERQHLFKTGGNKMVVAWGFPAIE